MAVRQAVWVALGPALPASCGGSGLRSEIQPFEDSAMPTRIGPAFALLTQARLRGRHREEGLHLYLVTGEESPGPALADLQNVPQTQALAAALYLLRLTWRRRRLIVHGSLFPADSGDPAAVASSLTPPHIKIGRQCRVLAKPTSRPSHDRSDLKSGTGRRDSRMDRAHCRRRDPRTAGPGRYFSLPTLELGECFARAPN